MPSQTFFNLSKEKQEALLEAAKTEFTKVTFHDASINQIIKEAGISRGSFYMYFESKEDLYSYMLKHYREALYEVMMQTLKENGGDMIEMFISVFNYMLDRYYQEEMPFFKNVIANMTFHSESFLFPKMTKEEKMQLGERLLQEIDTSKLNIKEEITVWDLFHLLQMVTIHSLMLLMKGTITLEEAKRRQKSEVYLLKEGLYK